MDKNQAKFLGDLFAKIQEMGAEVVDLPEPSREYDHARPRFHLGDRVRLTPTQWPRRLRGKTGQVTGFEWKGQSLGAPDGYWYSVHLDNVGKDVLANSKGLEKVPQ